MHKWLRVCALKWDSANETPGENMCECVLRAHTHGCPCAQKIHVQKRDVRSLSQESWNLAQVRKGHLVVLSPPGAVRHLLGVGKEVAATSGETQKVGRGTKSVWNCVRRWAVEWEIKYA